MDRNLLKQPFLLDSPPDWICPTCFKGILRIKKDSFVKQELRRSIEAHQHEEWDPTWSEYACSFVLKCTNDKCKEHVFSVGTGCVDWDVEYDNDGTPNQVYADFFRPTFFEPHLCLIPIPEKCPESVSKPLKESFKLFFSSPAAAANNVRIAIEELLTELGVKRFATVKGKRQPIKLHQRIQLLPPKYSAQIDLLLAIKWLGNAGSHGLGEVNKDDVMDAYELTEHVLEEIYSPKTKKLQTLANKVNRAKGPAK